MVRLDFAVPIKTRLTLTLPGGETREEDFEIRSVSLHKPMFLTWDRRMGHISFTVRENESVGAVG